MKTTTITNSKLFQSIITVCIFSAFGIAQNTLSIEVGDGTIDVLYNSDADIGGFQFTVEGATVTGTSGGDAAANGFTVTCNSTLCLGFSFSGAIIPPGSGTLVVVSADITGDVSLTGIVIADADGDALDFSFDSGPEAADYVVEVSNNVFTPDHLDISAGETVEWINMGGFHNVDGSTDTYPNNPDSFYNGTASSDLWSYSFTFTIAGNYDYECNPHAPSMAGTITVGSGGCTDDMACNYDAGAEFDDGSCLNNDCAGVCGGSAEVDECGVCGGDGSDDLGCGCFEVGPSGCDNVCGSTLENDECGVCGGDGIADGACDCAGNVDDCADICGGSTEVDECGICGGPGATGECGCDGIAEGTCDCDGNVLDECGVCGGDGIAEGFCDCTGNVDLGCGCGEAGPSGCDNACGSTLENDECGVCGGSGIADGACDCVGNVDDCAGICGGSAEVDECGECGGDGSACASSTIDILYNTTTDIGGFQFNVDGVTVVGASGGAAGENGFMISSSSTTVIAFSLTGTTIPAGSGILVQVEVDGDAGAACLSAVVLSDPVAGAIDNEVTDCLTISQLEIILGCTDVDACNYNADATEDDGSCTYAEENYDCDGSCTAEVDCAGECGGSAVVDDCGVCGGGNASMDECGVCGGDGSSCAPGVYGLALNDDGNLDVTYDSPNEDIYGFQFDVSAVTVTGTSGGAAADAGFTTSTGNNTVLGFSFSGASIPAGSGVLTVLSFEGSGEACLSNIVVSGYGGEGLETTGGECVTIEDCDDVDADGICDDVDDCVGEYDDCGVCNGGNADMDCAGECGGDAVVDECGECGGDGIADGACDCAGSVEDCAGVCGGDAVVDECGECGGDGIDEGACDCAGNVEDCAGECGGDAVVDECGECGGDGIADGACDCAGSVEDCAGECGGAAENCPDWVDCPSCYENTASMTAIVLDALSGDQMYADGDILAAFDDAGNNRGIAILLYPIPFGPYEGTGLYEIQIRGDAAGDAISFKYYDASEDEVLDSGTGYTFVIDDIIGDVVVPHEISVGAITLSIDIASGWNWFSLNVEGDMSIGSVMASLTSTDGDFIKSASASSTYYPDFGWYGGLEVLGVTGMYKFNSANADLLVFSGAPVDPLSTPIDLASGWNWLGFTPQNDGATADALATITTNDGDFIKNQGASSTYYNDFGWYGGLEVMAPTEGYMLSVAEGSTLTYPNFGPDDYVPPMARLKELPVAVSHWEVNYHDYEFNGHITMSIDSREDSHSDYIAAFVGDECRGVAERMYFPFGDSYMYSVMIYSNLADGEELTFKYYDSAIGEIVEYAETIDFTSDMIVGDGFNTYSLSSEASDMQQPMTYGISEAYPNPFNPVTSFEYTLEKDGMVQVAVYDLNGRMVSELVNGYQSAGSYPVVWDAQELSSGVYILNMIAGDYSTVQKVMLIK